MDVPGKKVIWYSLNQIRVRPPAPPIVEDAVLKNFFFCGGWGLSQKRSVDELLLYHPVLPWSMIITMVIMILVVVRIIMMMVKMINHQSIVTSASIDRTNYGEASDHLPINAVLQMWSSLPRKFQKWSISWGTLVQTKDKNFKRIVAQHSIWSNLERPVPSSISKKKFLVHSLFITNMIFSVDGDTGKHQ